MLHGRFGETNMTSGKIVLMGANGFIGSNLARYFVEKGSEVNIVLRKTSDPWRIKDLILDLNPIYISTGSKEEYLNIFKTTKPDFVINATGANQSKTIGDEASTWLGNFNGLVNIASALRNYPQALLIQLGSSFEYGKATLKKNPINEDFKCEPVSEYGVSKLFATEYLKYLGTNTKMRNVCVRIFNVYGQYEDPNRLVPSIILRMLNDSEVILKNPSVTRDFVHINDINTGIGKILEKENSFENSEIINIGTGVGHTVKEVTECAKKITKSNQSVNVDLADKRPENSFPGAIADTSRILKRLEWIPKISIEEGLRISIDWFREHSNLYNDKRA
jgi:UDP-glucose 4-epimerase